MCPRCRRSAELSSRGTNPIAALTWPACAKRSWRSTKARNVVATIRPIPGTLRSRATIGSLRGARLQPRIERANLRRQRRDLSARAARASRASSPARPSGGPPARAPSRSCRCRGDSPIAAAALAAGSPRPTASARGTGGSARSVSSPAAPPTSDAPPDTSRGDWPRPARPRRGDPS